MPMRYVMLFFPARIPLGFDFTPNHMEVHQNAVCKRCNNLFSSFVIYLDTA